MSGRRFLRWAQARNIDVILVTELTRWGTSTGTTMPHQELLTESQRLSLQAPASDERGMVRHYTLSSEDLALIHRRRGDPNRLGFALICSTPKS